MSEHNTEELQSTAVMLGNIFSLPADFSRAGNFKRNPLKSARPKKKTRSYWLQDTR